MSDDATVTPPSPPSISVVSRPSTVEIEKIKGSRFVANISPAASADDAISFIANVRDREPAASHHCWAYRIDPELIRASDDGEPAGTAGPPILRRLESASLWETAIVVTRYYGGTNLGTGGLIRAYGTAAAEAIAGAAVREKRRMASFMVRHPYDISAVIERVLAAYSGQVKSSEYTDVVSLTISITASTGSDFINDVRDATSGTVIPERL